MNPTSWLKAGAVSLDISILRRADKQPVAGVSVEATIEGAMEASQHAGTSDDQGRVRIEFPLPPLGKGGIGTKRSLPARSRRSDSAAVTTVHAGASTAPKAAAWAECETAASAAAVPARNFERVASMLSTLPVGRPFKATVRRPAASDRGTAAGGGERRPGCQPSSCPLN